MKKITAFVLCVLMVCGVFAGCGASNTNTTNTSTGNTTNTSTGKIKIVTTIFPIYDWVKEIVGDNENVELTMLLDKGVDLHSFQPAADDILKISACDMFIYVGGESDEWAEDALKESTNKNQVSVNLLNVLGSSVKEEEVKEGMEAEHEEEGEHEHEEEPEYDEHVWLSVKNAKTLCEKISAELCKLDAANKEAYQSNTTAYTAKLDSLDKEYEAAVKNAGVKTVLFGDRFPFRYLVDDYGLDYYAAFVGCSAESEASFETIVFLAKKVDELGLKAICQIESSDGKIAKTIKDNTKSKNQEVLTLDSLQSTTGEQAKSGKTYLSVMQSNLEVLKKALK